MNLKQHILNDLKQSMLQKNELRTSTLRLLLAAIKVVEVQGEKHEATDDEILKVLTTQVKHRGESIEEYRRGGREDLARKEEAERDILAVYGPTPLSEEKLAAIIHEAITKVGAHGQRDFGMVMKEVAPKTKGRTDGKMVADTVQKLLDARH